MGFIYNGISSQSMKIRARLTKWQVSPALRNSFETVPGKAGIADFGCDISERNIIISCSVLPQRSFADLVSVLDNVAEWLNPENGLKQLVIDDLPDRYFMARLSEAVDCERILRTAGSFELRFVSLPSTLKLWLISRMAFLNSFSPSIPIFKPKLSAT
jgi:predicted phage tail component-like protein